MSDGYWLALLVVSSAFDWWWRKRIKLRSYDEGYSHGLSTGVLFAVRTAITTASEVEQLRAKLSRCEWVAPEAERAP